MAELTYTKSGDYLLPNLILDNVDEHGTCTSMLLMGRLTPHLQDIDRQAREQADRTMTALMKRDGVNEELKTRALPAPFPPVKIKTKQFRSDFEPGANLNQPKRRILPPRTNDAARVSAGSLFL